MATLYLAHQLAQPTTKIWKAFERFEDVHLFHPRLLSSPLIGEQSSGVGAMRTCHFEDKNYLVEKVTKWEEGKSCTIEVTEGSLPLKKGIFTFDVHAIDEKRSKLVVTTEYEIKYGFLGKLLNFLVIQRKLKKGLHEFFQGLEQYLLTGEKQTIKTIKAATT